MITGETIASTNNVLDTGSVRFCLRGGCYLHNYLEINITFCVMDYTGTPREQGTERHGKYRAIGVTDTVG
jgi:hypothetical protein